MFTAIYDETGVYFQGYIYNHFRTADDGLAIAHALSKHTGSGSADGITKRAVNIEAEKLHVGANGNPILDGEGKPQIVPLDPTDKTPRMLRKEKKLIAAAQAQAANIANLTLTELQTAIDNMISGLPEAPADAATIIENQFSDHTAGQINTLKKIVAVEYQLRAALARTLRICWGLSRIAGMDEE